MQNVDEILKMSDLARLIQKDNFIGWTYAIDYDSARVMTNDLWKAKALGVSHDLRVHTYKPRFLTSNWKLFHDAVMAHRFFVIHELLPKYGICAA